MAVKTGDSDKTAVIFSQEVLSKHEIVGATMLSFGVARTATTKRSYSS